MHAHTTRLISLFAAAAFTAALAACTVNVPAATPTPSVGTNVSEPTSSPTQAEKALITADGYGAYQVKLTLAKAKADSLITGEQGSDGCPGWVTANGVGDYADVALVFYNGELLWLSVDKPGHETATGAQVAMLLAEVKAMYGNATELPGPDGAKALSVVSGKNTIFFRFTKSGTLESIEAGVAETLEFRYTEGEGC